VTKKQYERESHTEESDVKKIFTDWLAVVHGHGLATAVAGAPPPVISNLFRSGPADTENLAALNMAVCSTTVTPHEVIEQRNRMRWGGAVTPKERGVSF
jgi:hypothetical protein